LAAGVVYWQGQALAPGDASDPEQVAFGGRVYGRICSSCHGANLDGQLGWEEPMNDGTRLAPAHNEGGGTWHHSDEILFQVVKFGGDVLKTDGATSRMPAFENKLTDDEIWAVIAFIKSSWPNDVQEVQQSVAAE
jgi:mono/diheme cytochrome c family protein